MRALDQGLTPPPLEPATGDLLTGFVDCEGLIAAMLADFAADEREKERQNRVLALGVTDAHTRDTLLALAAKHHNRLSAIQEVQLAVSVGQHRDARYGDTATIGPVRELAIEECERWMKGIFEVYPKLRKAHRVMVGRERSRRGGLRSAEKLTKEERAERARKASRARWDKKSVTSTPKTSKGD